MEPLQVVADGLALGAVYALVALGFVLVLNGIGAANLAHGELVTLGGFIAVAIAAWLPSWPGIALLPVVAVLMALAGLVLSGLVPARLRAGAADEAPLASFAIGTVIAALLGGLFGETARQAPPLVVSGNFTWIGVTLSRQSLAIIVAVALLGPAVHLLLDRTQLGRRLRAAAQDPQLARALGIDTARMAATTFALGTALAGIAGLLLADRFAVAPGNGVGLLVKAYIAVAIAGWGQAGGACLVAVLIGLAEAIVAAVAPAVVADGLIYVGLLLLLAAQPQGLFGPAPQRRA